MGYGLWMLYDVPNPSTGRLHFGGPAYPMKDISLLGLWTPFPGSERTLYVGFFALLANLAVVVVATVVLRQLRVFNGVDGTHPSDYFADESDVRVPTQAPVAQPAPAGLWS
jgi:SSS family solute:Na+ symporter